jgi:hypothetical protein
MFQDPCIPYSRCIGGIFMFGRRADGRVLKKIDPIIALTP